MNQSTHDVRRANWLNIRKAVSMCQKFTEEELNTMNHDAKNTVIYQMQDRLDKLEHDYENLIEQIRLVNQERFGCHTGKLDDLVGLLSFFNEVEACYDGNAKEPTIEAVMDNALKKPRKPKQKGQLFQYFLNFSAASASSNEKTA